jgi:MFS superfamily sulfate permease-like transporter
MSKSNKNQFFSNISSDLPASLVVFLVAMPLCLGIALASGAPLFSGIIAGFVGGIVVTLMSKSPLGVSGPAAGLAVIVLTAIQELGAFETFLLAVVLAGVIQVVLGILKAGVIGYYFPSTVIKGMLSGIGILIILKQIPHAFGYDGDPEGDLSFIQTDGENTFSELFNMLDYISPGAAIISLLSLAVLILWERPFMKKLGFTKLVQGPLVVVLGGIGLNILFQTIPALSISADHLVSIPVAESLGGFFDQFTMPDFSQLGNPAVYTVAITMAIVASLETLLCVEATDKLDPEKRVTPTNRELVAQGVGNIFSGLIGGLPITQVIVRSSANIQSGGKSKASAFFHGVLLLVSAAAIPSLLNLIPLASLAAILLVVGYKLAKPSLFISVYKSGRQQFIPFVVTIVGIVLTDLLTGIMLGMAVAIVDILYSNFKRPFYFEEEHLAAGKPIIIQLSEDVTFLNKGRILRTLSHLPEGVDVIIDASKVQIIHPDVLEIIEDFMGSTSTREINVELKGLNLNGTNDPVKKFRRILSNKKQEIKAGTAL